MHELFNRQQLLGDGGTAAVADVLQLAVAVALSDQTRVARGARGEFALVTRYVAGGAWGSTATHSSFFTLSCAEPTVVHGTSCGVEQQGHLSTLIKGSSALSHARPVRSSQLDLQSSDTS